MKAARQRLFTPGDGATPPALTGREREEAVLTRCLADLLGGTSPPHNVVLTGPRGNGKTVLLNWFEGVCRHHKTDVDARAALVEPLAAHCEGIDADAVAAVVEDSQRYPYFVQLWGDALWQQRLATGATRLTAAHVDAARPDVAARVTDHYQERYRELETRGLLPAAVATAPLFQAGADATASDPAIDAALRPAWPPARNCTGSATSGARRANCRRSPGSPASGR